MTRPKKTAAFAAALVLAAVALGGCAGHAESGKGRLTSDTVKLKDGRSIECIYLDDVNRQGQGGISCDWSAQ
ncbi:hypothetical protein NQ036_03745 [Brevibacterium sp. 91QC2O2]|uniref:hypothetical protein n=1 Tax=Brevibacterium TaxID=1696 RepID=UPI00211C1E10|nr:MULTISPECIES: hypothetical protein [unclassified Brevibacterium]MCQ9367360.1 hypothetical protein [Brevibacterium sp. 91QC2O2]MCQ9384627.1 hypothetical protein [Brevibacterium sp. 68QC2CO]